METNAASGRRGGLFSGAFGLLVVAVGLFVLAWLNHSQNKSSPLNQASEEIAAAKAWVSERARDPQSVTYHHVNVGEGNGLSVVVLDFSGTNGFGGRTRNRWRFGFRKAVLELVTDEDTGKALAYGGALQALTMPAGQ